jgi:hypothetical protein
MKDSHSVGCGSGRIFDRLARGQNTTQDRLRSRPQLPDPERLYDVVIGPELEPEDPVDLISASRQDDDTGIGHFLDPASDLESVAVRKAQVDECQISAMLLKFFLERLQGVATYDVKAFLAERSVQDPRYFQLVIDDDCQMGHQGLSENILGTSLHPIVV